MSAQNLYPVPYHTFTLSGSKRDFLLPEFRPDFSLDLARPQEATDLDVGHIGKMHRRQMLKYGAAGAVAYGVLSADAEDAEAGFFGFIAASIFSAAIGWFVERVLDFTFEDRYGYRSYDVAIRARRVEKPRPTNVEFHNYYSENYTISNETVYNDTRNKVKRHKGYGVDFGVTEYVQLVDNNSCEIDQIKKELKAAPKTFYNEPLVAYSARRPVTDPDSRTLRRISTLYDLDVKASDVLYVQEQRDLHGRSHTGVAIRKGSKAQFLLDTDTSRG